MAQYIDKSALLAEIEKRMLRYEQERKTEPAYYDGLYTALEDLRDDFINTLEVKEVDLDFMLHEYWNLFPKITTDCLESATMTKDEMTNFAKHFFELGLKEQKGE